MQRSQTLDFPGCPVVKTLPSNAGDMGLIPDWGTNILHALWFGQKKKKKEVFYLKKKRDLALNWMLSGSRENSMVESFNNSYLEDVGGGGTVKRMLL